ncbi:NAD(P)/FAD-dependent oxidoreductase [Gordonia sp. HY442]|uniref:flavin-containing monooxygenase n=1 Tax=Gordonia zhenghanii TaxID=2911516 RepID=UPI001F483DA5|nr:NAD(P)/FAD-dependent oxidoreductase [Gordonia zhenghanii]MCF8608171.1 NAD(P)/FAD-dependent oxidoreductase [Gordonia zhenghanii]
MPDTPATTSVADYEVLVVGAGFSGLYLLHRLRTEGHRVHVVEQAPEVGGTWYWNRYPGARCDVESVDYSYSWDNDLQQEWDWTEKYPAQGDILAYLKHVADRFDLRKDIDFDTTLTGAEWDESQGLWTATAADGREYRARYLLMAVGCLSVPKDIDLPGFDNFEGRVLRTYDWPEGEHLTGQRVGVVGTGSTGAQVIPALAETVGDLTVVQRTPNFVIPTRNRPLHDGELEGIKADYPDRRVRNRTHAAGVFRDDNPKNAFEVDAEERRSTFQERWEGGGINFLGSFADLMFDQAANDAVAEFVHTKIDEIVDDPDTAGSLKPKSYPLGAKRPVVATDYYETYNRDNVHLVDVKKRPLDTFTEKGFRLADGTEYELDTMVLATGFDAFTGPFTKMDIRGTEGRSLAETWNRDGAKTHLGLGTAGFPNMIIVASVGSPSVLANMVTAIEQHVEWISRLLDTMREEGYTTIEAQEPAQEAWVQTVEDVAAMTLWPNGDSGSWYRGANIDGKVQIFMPYAAGIVEYGNAIDKSAANNYEGFTLS